MPTILSKIKSHVRAGNWKAEEHALNELQKDGFTVADAKHGILSAWEFDELTDDPPQVRYVLFGQAIDDRPLVIVVFSRGRSVRIKTAYEPQI